MRVNPPAQNCGRNLVVVSACRRNIGLVEVWGQDPIPGSGAANYDAWVSRAYTNKSGQIMESRSGEQIELSTQKLLQDLKIVVSDGEALLKAGAHDLSERAVAARERLAAALEVAKETRRKLEERARAGVKATDQMVRKHPYESIGVAFGIGLLIGVLVNRK